jgi:uncharacterized membrane-anchored protein YitT (DUF2179 family)
MKLLHKFPIPWQEFLLLTSGAVIQAVNVNLFLLPGNLAPGGVSGAAIIIREFTGWPIGVMMFIINIPLVVIGFRQLGRFRFLIRMMYVVILTSVIVDLSAIWLPAAGIVDDLMLNALYAAVLGGIGNGLIYRGQGSSGGTSILGRLVQLRTGIPISQTYIFTDGIIILIAGLVFGWEQALYALLTLFVWGVVTDQVLEGPSTIRMAFIISDQPQEISQAVIEQLGIGITALPGKGMYTEEEHAILFCTINRPDVILFQKVVVSTDPEAFIVIGQGHQAVGGVLPHQVGSPQSGRRKNYLL